MQDLDKIVKERLELFKVTSNAIDKNMASHAWYSSDPMSKFKGFEREKFSTTLIKKLRVFFSDNKGLEISNPQPLAPKAKDPIKYYSRGNSATKESSKPSQSFKSYNKNIGNNPFENGSSRRLSNGSNNIEETLHLSQKALERSKLRQ
jgi:hypothetical protein